MDAITQVLPNYWKEILSQSEEFEKYLDNFSSFFNKTTLAFEDVSNVIFEEFSTIKDNLPNKIKESVFYKKNKDFQIDFSTLFNLPEDFDVYNKEHLHSLIEDKMQLLKTVLTNLDIGIIPLDLILDEFENLIKIVFALFEDFDFDSYKWTELKASVFNLFQLIFDSKLENLPFDTEFEKIKTLASDLLDVETPETVLEYLGEVKKNVSTIKEDLSEITMPEGFDLKGFDLDSFLNELESVFTISTDFKSNYIKDIITLIQVKWIEFMNIMIHLVGKEASATLVKLQSDIYGWLKIPAETMVATFLDVFHVILTNITTALKNVNLGPIGAKVYGVIEKLHVIVSLIKDNGFKLKVKEKQQQTRRSAEDKFVKKKSNSNKISSDKKSTHTQKLLKSSFAQKDDFAEEKHTYFNLLEIIKELYIHKKNEAIASLTPQQKLLLDILNGDWFATFIEDLYEHLWEEGWIFEMMDRNHAFINTIRQEKTVSFVAVANYFYEEVEFLLSKIIKKGKALVEFFVKSISTVVKSILALLKEVKIPTDWIPDFIKKILSDDDKISTPNLLCLILAIPYTTLIKLLTLSIEDIQTWKAA